jgi:hypothetical protein
VAITSVAAAPTAPPTIASVFELPLPEDGVALPVGPVEGEVEAPIIAPGPISGLKEGVKRPKQDGVILTTGGLRCDGVPEVLHLVCAVSSLPGNWLVTNRDANESPMGYNYRRWDRVRESMGRLRRQYQCYAHFPTTETHVEEA